MRHAPAHPPRLPARRPNARRHRRAAHAPPHPRRVDHPGRRQRHPLPRAGRPRRGDDHRGRQRRHLLQPRLPQRRTHQRPVDDNVPQLPPERTRLHRTRPLHPHDRQRNLHLRGTRDPGLPRLGARRGRLPLATLPRARRGRPTPSASRCANATSATTPSRITCGLPSATATTTHRSRSPAAGRPPPPTPSTGERVRTTDQHFTITPKQPGELRITRDMFEKLPDDVEIPELIVDVVEK